MFRSTRTGASYYQTRLQLGLRALPRVFRGRMVPGTPAKVQMQTSGHSALSYFLKPVTDQLAPTFLEEKALSKLLFDRRALLGAGLGTVGGAALAGCQAFLPTYRFPFRLTTAVEVDGDVREAVGGGVMLWRQLRKGAGNSAMARDQESGCAGLVDLGPEGLLMVTLSRYRAAGHNRWVFGHPWDPTYLALQSLGLASEGCDEDGDCTGLRELIRRAADVRVTLKGDDIPIVLIARAPWSLEDLTVVEPPALETFVAPKTRIVSCILELKQAPNTIPDIQRRLPWLESRSRGSLGTGTGSLYPNYLRKETFYQDQLQ